jgi:hypothetical protein
MKKLFISILFCFFGLLFGQENKLAFKNQINNITFNNDFVLDSIVDFYFFLSDSLFKKSEIFKYNADFKLIYDSINPSCDPCGRSSHYYYYDNLGNDTLETTWYYGVFLPSTNKIRYYYDSNGLDTLEKDSSVFNSLSGGTEVFYCRHFFDLNRNDTLDIYKYLISYKSPTISKIRIFYDSENHDTLRVIYYSDSTQDRHKKSYISIENDTTIFFSFVHYLNPIQDTIQWIKTDKREYLYNINGQLERILSGWDKDTYTQTTVYSYDINGSLKFINEVENNYKHYYFYSIKNTNKIKSNWIKNEISLFPNPTKDVIKIKSFIPIKLIKIFDLNGKVVKIANINNLDYSLSLDNVSSGIYILEFLTNQKVIFRRIIKY